MSYLFLLEMIVINSKINIKTGYLIIIELILKLLNILSIGLFYPFFLYLRYRFVYSKTYISGYKLEFKGNLFVFYFKYFGWYILNLLTLGIYNFFLEFKLYKWAVSCTYINDIQGQSYFEKDELESLLLNILCTFLLIITFGLSFPLVKCIRYRYRARNTLISNKRLKYIGNTKMLVKMYIRWIILSISTLGCFILFIKVLDEKHRIEHTIINDNDFEEKESIAIDYVYANTNPLLLKLVFLLGYFLLFFSFIFLIFQQIILLVILNIVLFIILFFLYDILTKYLIKIDYKLISKIGKYYLIFLLVILSVSLILIINKILMTFMIILINYIVIGLLSFIAFYFLIYKKQTIL